MVFGIDFLRVFANMLIKQSLNRRTIKNLSMHVMLALR